MSTPVPQLAPNQPATTEMYPELSSYQWSAMYDTFQRLQGRVLTVIDSIVPEGQQNRAAKDVITQTLWDGYGSLCSSLNPTVIGNSPTPPRTKRTKR